MSRLRGRMIRKYKRSVNRYKMRLRKLKKRGLLTGFVRSYKNA